MKQFAKQRLNCFEKGNILTVQGQGWGKNKNYFEKFSFAEVLGFLSPKFGTNDCFTMTKQSICWYNAPPSCLNRVKTTQNPVPEKCSF